LHARAPARRAFRGADSSGDDLASLAANWTAAMVNSLQFEMRRRSGRSDTTLRIVSIRLIVTTSD
jgi:hypothetical protein